MGRGTGTQDKFAGIFGTRRGSRSAQDTRDKQEMADTIHAYFATHSRLTSNSLIPLAHIFSDDAPLIQGALSDCIWQKIGQDGWEDFHQLLFDHSLHLSPAVQKGLHSFAITYITDERYGTQQERLEIAGKMAISISKHAEERPTSDIEYEEELVDAIARLWREDPGPAGYPISLAIALARQPGRYLPLYREWEDTIRTGIDAGHYDGICHLAVDALWSPSTPPPTGLIRELRRAFIERSKSPEFTGQIGPIMKAA